MSLLHPSLQPKSTWEFEAEIVILHHATTLVNGYSPMMHIGVVTQAVRITKMFSLKGEPLEALRTRDRAIVHCRFAYRPELINVRARLCWSVCLGVCRGVCRGVWGGGWVWVRAWE